MLKIVRSANADFVLFTLSGYIDTEHIAELQAAFDGEALPIVLDLREVKRVDREVVADLARWNADGIKSTIAVSPHSSRSRTAARIATIACGSRGR